MRIGKLPPELVDDVFTSGTRNLRPVQAAHPQHADAHRYSGLGKKMPSCVRMIACQTRHRTLDPTADKSI